jgi:[acyl-carrier-protein] S-malonyltransferase
MAQDIFNAHEDVRDLYQSANEILGFDLAKKCFEGPEEELKQTLVTQPAIYVHSVALTQFLREKQISKQMVAGHSLGEYSALFSANVFNFEDGLKLVKIRAEEMQKAGQQSEGTMAAIIGLEADILDAICKTASQKSGIVSVANYNSSSQIVISGSVAGVEAAMEIAKEKGAKRVVPLVVGGAFHSTLMQPAAQGLKVGLERAVFKNAEVPVYTNVTARPETGAAELKSLLLSQLTSPVRWVEIIQNMISDGAQEFYEIGPGSVLAGLVKRMNREVSCFNINSLESLDNIMEAN